MKNVIYRKRNGVEIIELHPEICKCGNKNCPSNKVVKFKYRKNQEVIYGSGCHRYSATVIDRYEFEGKPHYDIQGDAPVDITYRVPEHMLLIDSIINSSSEA